MKKTIGTWVCGGCLNAHLPVKMEVIGETRLCRLEGLHVHVLNTLVKLDPLLILVGDLTALFELFKQLLEVAERKEFEERLRRLTERR